MAWSEKIKPYIEQVQPIRVDAEVLQKVTQLLDLTRLKEDDTENNIAFFIEKARTIYRDYGHLAAVCIYSQFVRLVATEFADTPVKAVTVANFPSGTKTLEDVLLEIGIALQNGAQEIDMVFPYQQYLKGDKAVARTFVESCKAACGDATLKVILETGAFNDLDAIADATRDALNAGADFIKTSTGKMGIGATVEAAATILLVIKDLQPTLQRTLGFKASGGIKTLADAAQYILLADNIMGKNWASSKTMRIGSSQLIDEIIKENV